MSDTTLTGDQIAKRNAGLLALFSAMLGSAAPISIALGALAGSYLLGEDKSLQTAPITAFVVGVALGAIPAAWLMKVLGRRLGIISGTAFSAFGGGLAAYALIIAGFWLFVFALAIIGVGQAFNQQVRFVAADTASEAFKPTAIAWVMAGGILSAVIGPQTALLTKDLFDPVSFAGAFAAIVVIAAVAALIGSFLKVAEPQSTGAETSGVPARPLSEIVLTFPFFAAVICAAGAYSLMNLVMTAAPLAMIACGFNETHSTLGIQWHVIAMFAPSFFTGHLIRRFGKAEITALGFLIIASCSAFALTGISLVHFWGALILLGVGWNFAFIGATTLLTDCYRPHEKEKVQGFNDFIVFGNVALASMLSGYVQFRFGWDVVNLIAFPVTGFCLFILFVRRNSGRGVRTA